ncbi:MAG: Radical SAM superfamily protein [Methanosaeta sp. PtaB.Bin039]|nr:MAG: Radical SAM superfamily protein [Methanosaeta sp. PtaB.Bin039]OPY46640.1 MAG: Radical SAM superfamily protein [Methanosaeta sp. PtaU1.Bin028]HOT05983.1 radical SAM protein [Methanotrichaceae archaeon]HQF16813.1 radical SAM protein [Methanotrichaceae archaeon]HQI90139.1 radical SAM protein [Methanotrichaceae archaeon]
MVALEKLIRLSQGCYDKAGPDIGQRPPDEEDPWPDEGKVRALGLGTRHDVCASSASPRGSDDISAAASVARSGICHAFTHSGRCVSLFKTLYTNRCFHQCGYCSNASGCRERDLSYTPQELARATMALYQGNYVEGLFLSSGLGRDQDHVMEEMLEAVRLLRNVYSFKGYIHFKILPGAARHLIEEAMSYSDRVSINVEAASASLLDEISPSKDYERDILQRQRYIRDLQDKVPLPAGQTTQYVVGGAGEADLEIFQSLVREYREMGIRRAYFSSFSPLPNTHLADLPSQPGWREARLYQVDWLYRVYRFSVKEIEAAFDQNGFLRDQDPKVAVARSALDGPVDPNQASYAELIRVPGIGPRGAKRILSLRKSCTIKSAAQLASLGVRRAALSYLKLNGWAPTTLDRWCR